MQINLFSVNEVKQHPDNENWTVVYFGGGSGDKFNVISSKLEDGSNRYNEGDVIIYCPTNAILPEYMLKHGYWDEIKNKGCLGGSKGNRVKPFKGSTGIIFPVSVQQKDFGIVELWCCGKLMVYCSESYFQYFIEFEFDFAPMLQIGEYIPEQEKRFWSVDIGEMTQDEAGKYIIKFMENNNINASCKFLHTNFSIENL